MCADELRCLCYLCIVIHMTSLIDNEELDRQIDEAQKEFDELAFKLDLSRNRLRKLTNIRDLVRALERPDETQKVSDRVYSTADSIAVMSPSRTAPMWTVVTTEGGPVEIVGGKKRIRSTGMVADLVIEANKSLTREEIHTQFKNLHDYPEGWKNPTTALNNAIARAVANGLIVELNGRYMSRDVAEREEQWEALGEPDG